MAEAEDDVAFARSPARLSEALLNYRIKVDRDIYNTATAPLELKINGESGGLLLFLEMIRERADTGVARNLLAEYGQLTLENVRAFALTYVGQNGR